MLITETQRDAIYIASLDYLNMWFSIIPMKFEGKNPIIKSWKEWQEKKPTKNDLDWWFKKFYGLNMAIVTWKISWIVVVDIDKWANLETLDLPETVTVESGWWGYHFYYKYPIWVDELKNSASKLARHIDIRWDWGCIVAPPSIHKSWNPYKWKEWFWLWEIEMAELPEWIIKESQKSKEWGKKVTLDELSETKNPEGSRNSNTIRYAWMVAKKNWTTDNLGEIILEYNKNNNIPPLPSKEIKDIVNYVIDNFEPSKNTKMKEGKKQKEEKLKEIILINQENDKKIIETIVDSWKPKMRVYDKESKKEEIIDNFIEDKYKYISLPINNSLFISKTLLFPNNLEEQLLGKNELLEKIRKFIYKYVDCSNEFLIICSYYVILTYFYKNYEVLPYLRIIWDYWSWKSQILKTVWSICYNPMLMNGSASLATVFRVLSMVKWTLVFDEADIPESDTTNDFIKILNNWYQKWMNVLRCDWNDFSPQSFEVFWPKIIWWIMEFQDKATESRCLTEVMKSTKRNDIQDIDKSFHLEAEKIRNLCFTFWRENIDKKFISNYDLSWLEPRQKQIIKPLLSIIDDEKEAEIIINRMKKLQEALIEDRKFSLQWAIFYEIKKKIEENKVSKIYLFEIVWYLNSSDEYGFKNLKSQKIWQVLRRYNLEYWSDRDSKWFFLDFNKNLHKLNEIFNTLKL